MLVGHIYGFSHFNFGSLPVGNKKYQNVPLKFQLVCLYFIVIRAQGFAFNNVWSLHKQTFWFSFLFRYFSVNEDCRCSLSMTFILGMRPHSWKWVAGKQVTPKPSPPPRSVENCLPQKQSLGPKRLGAAVLGDYDLTEILVEKGRRNA